MLDIQEINRMVRLAKTHTDLALPVCKVGFNQMCFVSCGDASGGSTRAEPAQAGHVVMVADQALSEGKAAPHHPGILEISSCLACCGQCFCS